MASKTQNTGEGNNIQSDTPKKADIETKWVIKRARKIGSHDDKVEDSKLRRSKRDKRKRKRGTQPRY